jgi:hypothetical protein
MQMVDQSKAADTLAELRASMEQATAVRRQQANLAALSPIGVAPTTPAPIAPVKKSRHRKVAKVAQDLVKDAGIADKAPTDVAVKGKSSRPRKPQTPEELAAKAEAKKDVRNTRGQFAPGNTANPHGRTGAAGTGGVSMRYYFEQFWNRLNDQERESMWQALFQKAAYGDIAASKLLLQFNRELDQPVMQVEADQGVRISLTVPQRDE